jgi:hypothetical protein
MAMNSWLALYPEATYGVWNGAATPLWIPLTEGNSFRMDPVPQRAVFRSADARNRPSFEVSSRKILAGSLTTKLYSDGTSPNTFADTLLTWATTITSDDIPSFSAQFYDSRRARRLLGIKIRRCTGTEAAETEEGVVRLTFDLVGQKPDTVDPTFTEPARTVFPKNPYKHIETKGGLILATAGSTPRTKYKSLTWAIENDVVAEFDEDQYVSDVTYNGRRITASLQVRFVAKTDRDNFESQAVHAFTVLYTKAAPAHTLSLDFKDLVYIAGLDKDLPLNTNAYETISLEGFVGSTGADFSFATT